MKNIPDVLATIRDIRGDESSLLFCLGYVTSVNMRRAVANWGRLIALSLDALLRLVDMRRVVASWRRLVA